MLLSQVLALLLLGASLVGILTSDASFTLWLNVTAFVATAILVTFLLASLKKEDDRHEELQQLTHRLAKANEDLRESDRVRTEFLSIATHQLRTPLTVIKGYLALLREGAYGPLTEAASEKVGHVFEMNERMIQSISNLLNVTRIEKKRIQYNVGEVDVNVALSQLADDMRFKAEQVGSTFAFALPPEPLPHVRADADKMREVLSNLIDNAFKYTPKGGTVTLAATTLNKEKKVKFTVTDTGMGISEKDAKRLFQQFYRANAKNSGIEGTGIGLFICKTFAEGMGGKVWLESSVVGKGSTFALTLPIMKQKPQVK